jgi:hypothetical protein
MYINEPGILLKPPPNLLPNIHPVLNRVVAAMLFLVDQEVLFFLLITPYGGLELLTQWLMKKKNLLFIPVPFLFLLSIILPIICVQKIRTTGTIDVGFDNLAISKNYRPDHKNFSTNMKEQLVEYSIDTAMDGYDIS